jgi:DNA-binding response OmpR family regulator
MQYGKNIKQSNHILLVEDDNSIARFIELELNHAGYEVTVENDGIAAVESFKINPVDMVILDLMLPGLDGYGVFSEIKKQAIDVPVIMLTAKKTTHEVVLGLEAGADDYIRKPFEMPELLARIRNLLKRKATPIILTYADLAIDQQKRLVTRADCDINLTALEFDLLVYLINNHESVLSRDQIYQAVWNESYLPGTNVVDVFIRRLRRKVDEPFTEHLIETVRSVGYSLRVKR